MISSSKRKLIMIPSSKRKLIMIPSSKILKVDHDTIIKEEVDHDTIIKEEVDHDTIIKEEVDHDTIIKEEVDHDTIIKEEVDHDTIIKEKVDHDITKTGNSHQTFIKEEPNNSEIMKTVADPDNIKIKREYCFSSISFIEPVVHDVFDIKQESKINFNIKDEYGYLNVSNDICIKEEEIQISEHENSESESQDSLCIMAASEEYVNKEEIIRIHSSIKDKKVFMDCLYEFNNEELKQYHLLLLKLSKCYNLEIKNITEEKRNPEDKIFEAIQEFLKTSPKTYKASEDYNFVLHIYNNIENGQINEDEIEELHLKLITVEKNMKMLSLFTSFVRGYYYKFLKNKGMHEFTLTSRCNISKRQLYNYLSFYKLVNEYKLLVKINLSFTTIVKNKKILLAIIDKNDNIKEFLKQAPF